MTKKNLIVLDIDDTLTKSEIQHQTAFVDALKYFGITKINQDWKTYQNVTDNYIFKVIFERNFQKPFQLSMVPDFEKKMTNNLRSLQATEAIPGVNEVLEFFLKKTNYAICVATGCLLEPAILKLQQAGIHFIPDLLEASNKLFTREEIVKSAIKKAKNYFDVENFEQIISVGDGIWDLRTAKNLGIHFLGIRDKNLELFLQEGIKSHITDWKAFNFEKVKKELAIQ